jgi:tetratricopeptide (TPR) repeat protein
MLINSRRVERLLVVGLAVVTLGAGTGDSIYEDHHKSGYNLLDRGDYAAAEAHFRAAMEAARAFPERDPRFGHIVTDLAWALYRQARYAQAESFAIQSLTSREAAFGRDHTEVAYALDALGVIHHARGRYVEAAELRQQSIAIFEKTLGKDDPDVATSLNSLIAEHL